MIISLEMKDFQSEVTAQALPKVMWDPGVEFIACFHESSSLLASPNTVLNLLKRLVTCLDLCYCQLPCRPSKRSDYITEVLSCKLHLYPAQYRLSPFNFQNRPSSLHTALTPNLFFFIHISKFSIMMVMQNPIKGTRKYEERM